MTRSAVAAGLAVLMAVSGAASAGAGPLVSVAAESTYVLVVYGDTQSAGAIFPLPTGTVISCTNLRTGAVASGAVGETSRGFYEAVFFSSDIPVATVGDVLQLSVPNVLFIAPNGLYTLSAEDVLLGAARMDAAPDGMSAAPLPDLGSAIRHCYPNPFNPNVSIQWEVGSDAPVELAIYDVRGREVRTLVGGHRLAGLYATSWNGLSDEGQAVSSGIYLAVLRSSGSVSVQKLVLAR